jgi:ABC-type sugar transport system ATPase subunit
VTKTFDSASTPILSQVSLEVPDGEFLTLLGPSAAGKTTLLRCLAGLEQPTAGDVVIGDQVVTRAPPAARDVAMVFQAEALYPHLTVRGNLAFPLEVRGAPRSLVSRRVLVLAERLGLERILDRRPARLSGGERQRVALGRALVRDPKVLLLDEPLAHLDPAARSDLAGAIARWHVERPVTTLHVTQDLTEAFTLARRVAVLDAGRIRQVGTPREVYLAPADTQVARLMGRPGMNVLSGTAHHLKAGTEVRCGPLLIPVPLRAYEGQILLGIRPENVSIGPAGRGMGDAAARLIEPSGPDTLLHLDTGEGAVIARIPGFLDLTPGTAVGVTFDVTQLHFFDSSGIRLG